MIRASSVSTLLLIACTMHVGRPSSVNDTTRRRRRDTIDNCINNVCHNDASCFSLADEAYYCKCKTGFRGDGVSYCTLWDDVANPGFKGRSNSLGAPVIAEPSTTDTPLTKAPVASRVPVAPVPSVPTGLPSSFFADDDIPGSPTAPSNAPVDLESDESMSLPPAWTAMLQSPDSPNDETPSPTAAPIRVVPPRTRLPHPSPHSHHTVINDSHVLKGPLR